MSRGLSAFFWKIKNKLSQKTVLNKKTMKSTCCQSSSSLRQSMPCSCRSFSAAFLSNPETLENSFSASFSRASFISGGIFIDTFTSMASYHIFFVSNVNKDLTEMIESSRVLPRSTSLSTLFPDSGMKNRQPISPEDTCYREEQAVGRDRGLSSVLFHERGTSWKRQEGNQYRN